MPVPAVDRPCGRFTSDGFGQLLHGSSGLAWAGAAGIQRKTAGAGQGLDNLERVVAMGLMGAGGIISIIGGVLFLIIMIHCMAGWRSHPTGADATDISPR
ncbi:MAG: hypothetical protein U5P41_02615 [Gammaproteobacteria bacterium]|nr:hypothetical protein [Gammaproteobacteria bacterium]